MLHNRFPSREFTRFLLPLLAVGALAVAGCRDPGPAAGDQTPVADPCATAPDPNACAVVEGYKWMVEQDPSASPTP